MQSLLIICRIISAHTKTHTSRVSGDVTLTDIPGFSASNYIDILLDVEQAFGIEITMPEVTSIKTVNHIDQFVESKLAGR